jgi:aminopeptidase N/puromycin-sensitive aminopeptidase
MSKSLRHLPWSRQHVSASVSRWQQYTRQSLRDPFADLHEDSMIFRRSFLSCPLLAFVAALACVLLAPAVPATAQRLPDNVRPSHYTLTLTPDLKAAIFSGLETIDVTLAEPTDRITLNAAEIDFQSVTVTASGKQQTAAVSLDKDKEQATFTFPEKLARGQAALSIAYTGILNNDLRGFYLSKTPRRNYAVTQFESTDARRAFPSFDEPAFKATFDISLVIDAADTAISNTPIESDTPNGESSPGTAKHTLKFLTTPKMSTYLVAFLVGDFKCSAGDQDGVAIRVCSTPDKVALTPYGVDVAKFVLHYYNTYFGISYPLKKLDLIGLPDFAAGAMENFGAITYRETDLLLDPKTASVDAKVRVALVIAHEMAHQWFGDLVTMQWWDNVWLNEGFATWMENKAVAAMHPEWNMDQGVSADEDDTLNLDALPTTRSIRARADTPDEIEQMFDGISYGKASDVLLTVENYLGEETFRNGVHAYLAAHLYANATAEDFWNAQTAVSHKPVDKIMESLVAQRGEPLLTFGNPAGGRVSVAQRRFYLSPSVHPDPIQKWTLPVCFKTSSGQSCQILTPADSTLKVPASGLFFVNSGAKGYYRSAYTPAAYAVIAAAIETGLDPTERIRFLGDEWAQLRDGKATVGDYLNLAAAVHSDPNAEVVAQAIAGIAHIYTQIAATPEEKAALSAWIRRTYAPDYSRLGLPSERDSSNTRELRNQLFNLLGHYGKDAAVLAQAHQMAQNYLLDPTSIDPTLSRNALAIAARNSDAALFDRLQKVAETATDPTVQNTALRLLAEFQNPALVQRSLDYAASGKVRNQDAAIQFSLPLRNAETRPQAWAYIQSHWDKVQAQLAIGMGSRVVGSVGEFCSADARDDVEKFFSTHKLPESNVPLKRAIESINGCIELRVLQQPSLDKWLVSEPKP